jgi:cation transport regulator ChaB
MLKRKGQLVEHSVAGTPAFAVIQPELDQLTDLKYQIDRCRSLTDSLTTTASLVVEGVEWQIQRRLLKLPATEVFLCHDPRPPTFAIVQRFRADSVYARANSQAEILATGATPRQLVRDYADDARHTLRFMASNLVAQAQRVAWEQFPERNPSRVMRAISERCHQVAGNHEAMRQQTGQPGVRV